MFTSWSTFINISIMANFVCYFTVQTFHFTEWKYYQQQYKTRKETSNNMDNRRDISMENQDKN